VAQQAGAGHDVAQVNVFEVMADVAPAFDLVQGGLGALQAGTRQGFEVSVGEIAVFAPGGPSGSLPVGQPGTRWRPGRL